MTSAIIPAEVQAAAEREGFSGSEYNLVAMGARLTSIRLLKLRLDTAPDGLADDGRAELAFDRRVDSCRYDPDTNSAAAIFRFSVSVQGVGTEAFGCTADYAVLYDVPHGSKAEAATSFCKHVGSFAAYPYFRAVAAQMAWNAGVDLPPLPTIAAMPVVGRETGPKLGSAAVGADGKSPKASRRSKATHLDR